MKKHWLVYRIPFPFANRAGEIRQGEVYEANGVSFRAAELAAQQCAQNQPGTAFAVLEVNKIYVTEPVEPVVPPVMEQVLPDEVVDEEAGADDVLPELPDFGGLAVLR